MVDVSRLFQRISKRVPRVLDVRASDSHLIIYNTKDDEMPSVGYISLACFVRNKLHSGLV